jgi:hypothetical protein
MPRSLIRFFACVTVMASALAIEPTASFADSPSTAASATLKRDSLMPLAFPGWQRGDTGTPSNPKLPATEIVKLTLDGESSAEYFVEPKGVIRLDAQHAAMITYTVPINPESGELDDGCDGSHYCPPTFLVGAYFFTQSDAGWILTSRADRLPERIRYQFDDDFPATG